MGKWAYTLVEYDLEYESLKAMKGQVVADFIVDHGLELDDALCIDDAGAWPCFSTDPCAAMDKAWGA
jgi:hypothetical protein